LRGPAIGDCGINAYVGDSDTSSPWNAMTFRHAFLAVNIPCVPFSATFPVCHGRVELA
jgi:hypothetical protein